MSATCGLSVSDVCGVIGVIIGLIAIFYAWRGIRAAHKQIKISNEQNKLMLMNKFVEFVHKCGGMSSLIHNIVQLKSQSIFNIEIWYYLNLLRNLNDYKLNKLLYDFHSECYSALNDNNKTEPDNLSLGKKMLLLKLIYTFCAGVPIIDLNASISFKKLKLIEHMHSFIYGKYVCTTCKSEILTSRNNFCWRCFEPNIIKKPNIFGKYIW